MIRFGLRYYALAVLVFMFLAGTAQAKKPTEEEQKELVATKLFAAGNWKKLEQILTDSLQSQERTKTETSIFRCYKLGADIYHFQSSDKSKQRRIDYIKKLKAWQVAYPKSLFTPSYELRYWLSKAYGEPEDDDIPSPLPADWLGAKACLEKATAIFEDCTANGAYPDPSFYGFADRLASVQNWELDDIYEKIKRPVIDNHPWFYDDLSRHTKAFYKYEDGWRNSADLMKYYNRVADDLPEEYSDLFYAAGFLRQFAVADSMKDIYLVDMNKGSVPYVVKIEE